MKRDNLIILVLVFCIVTLLLLSTMIYYKGNDYSCDQCYINFKQNKVSGVILTGEFFNFKVRAIDLYTNLTDGYCLVKWDPVQGHIRI